MEDRNYRANFRRFYEPIQMPGGYYFDHVKTLKTIDLYTNGQFERGSTDSQGFYKYFKQKTQPAVDVADKFVDLDTKDVILRPDGDSDFKIWVMQRDLKQWMKDADFATILNVISENYPKYGTVVLKKAQGKVSYVKIQNLRMDTAAERLDLSPFIYELVEMSGRQISKMANWDSNAVKQLFVRGLQPKYVVYDCYDYSLTGNKQFVHTVKADLFTQYHKESGFRRSPEAFLNEESNDIVPSLTLFTEETDDLPYRELHWKKVPGRWLGLGIAEYLFDNQIRANEVANIKAKSLYHNGVKLYQTADEAISRNNVLTDAENGDIIKTSSPITPVDNTERNLAYFTEESNDWDRNTVEKTFTTEMSRGENLPSRTPLGVANIQASMLSSFFEKKRENYGIFVRKLLLDDIIPGFKKSMATEHTLMFSGSEAEMDFLDHAISEAHVWEAAMKYAEKHGFFPSQEEVDSERQRVKGSLGKNRGRQLKIPAMFYENARFIADIITTGEQLDTGTLQQTLQTAMQIVGTNPAVLQDPGLRAIFFKMLELAGVSPVDLDMMNTQIKSAPPVPVGAGAPQGGSVSVVPSGIANPSFVPKKQVL